MVDDLSDGVLAPFAAVPPGVASLADYERLAPQHLPPETWAHIAQTAGRHDPDAAFAQRRLVPRALASLAEGTTAATLFGRRHRVPLLIAPLAYAGIAHRDAEFAVAQAAGSLETGMVVSTLASRPLEAIAQAHRDAAAALGREAAPLWFQLYLQPRNDDSLALVRRAEAAGYEAIVLTIDAAIKRSTFRLPEGVCAANLSPSEASRHHYAVPGGAILFGTPLARAAPTWDDLAWLRAATTLPVIVKGMMGADDARRMAASGIDALILSDHGGRVFDRLAAPLDMLPSITAAMDLPVLMDGGLRSGSDIVVALAAGATAVLIGRPVLYALAVAGVAGVAHVAHLLRAELEAAMAQLGCASLADVRSLERIGF